MLGPGGFLYASLKWRCRADCLQKMKRLCSCIAFSSCLFLSFLYTARGGQCCACCASCAVPCCVHVGGLVCTRTHVLSFSVCSVLSRSVRLSSQFVLLRFIHAHGTLLGHLLSVLLLFSFFCRFLLRSYVCSLVSLFRLLSFLSCHVFL